MVVSWGWDVEKALGQLVDAIQSGAKPLIIEEEVREEYKNRYRADFQWQKSHGADWEKDQFRILPLGRLVGALAKSLTLLKAEVDLDPPKAVDGECAYLAGFLVAMANACPPMPHGGHWCDNYKNSQFTFRGKTQNDNEGIANFRSLLEDLGVL